MKTVVFYTRAGCHLCDEAKKVLQDAGVAFEAVDIDRDPKLRELYNEEVPVIFIDGKKAFKYRIDPQALTRRLNS